MTENNPSLPADDDVICKCFSVTEAVIRACIEENDLKTIESVTQACQAGGGCHSCHILLQLFIDQHQGRNSSQEEMVAQHGEKVKRKGMLNKFLSRFRRPLQKNSTKP
ncbi:MAG: (2Fe-2S)-binding protein [Nitrospinales bacterium]